MAHEMNPAATAQLPRLTANATWDRASKLRHVSTASALDPRDEVLLREVSDGANEGLSILFSRYAQIVRGIGYRVLRDACEADHLLQDVFILTRSKCCMFDPSRGSARFWILQVAYRSRYALARDRYRNSRHFYTRTDLEQVENELSDRQNGGGVRGYDF
jgi:DNA-directed RNA polymerase specialized sigma24 family protein